MNRIQMQTQAQTYAQTHAQTQLQTTAETFFHAQLQTHAHQNVGPHAGLNTNSQAPMQAPAPHALQSRAWLPENLTLTDTQADTLVAMIEEERMAGDIYELLAEQTGLVVFDRIAASEDRHEGALLRLAEACGLSLAPIPRPALDLQRNGEALVQTLDLAELLPTRRRADRLEFPSLLTAPGSRAAGAAS